MANLRVDKITSTETFEKTGSVQFDASSGTGLVVGSSDCDFGTGDFTIEGWFLVQDSAAIRTIFDSRTSDNQSTGFFLGINTDDTLYTYAFPSGAGAVSYGTPEPNTWHHVAVVRNGSDGLVFLDGKLVSSGVRMGSSDYTQEGGTIGQPATSFAASLYRFKGHISNFRVVKGVALYTSNFKPSMRELEVTAETVLLACQSKTDASLEKTGKTITVNGTAVASELTPGILTPVVKSGAGSAITGSVEFTGSPSKLTVDSVDFAMGSNDLTMECWFYNGVDTAAHLVQIDTSPTQSPSNITNFSLATRDLGSGDVRFLVRNDSGSNLIDLVSPTGFANINAWHHLAGTIEGTTARLFLNGNLIKSGTLSGTRTHTGQRLNIGANQTSRYLKGYLSNVRIVKGTALYTADFIPPTRELKRVPGTVLLCCQDSNSPLTEATGKTITGYGSLQRTDGPELVTNGYFNNGTTGWTGQNATLSLVSGNLVVTANAGSYSSANQAIATVVGQRYALIVDIISDAGTPGIAVYSSGWSAQGGDVFYLVTSIGRRQIIFTATSTTSTISLQTSGANSTIGYVSAYAIPHDAAAPASNFTPQVGDDRQITFEGVTKIDTDAYFYLPTGDTASRETTGTYNAGTRGIMMGGIVAGGSTRNATIDYWTMASTGDAVNFGDCTGDSGAAAGFASRVRGVSVGGYTRSAANFDYVTIMSTGNALDFGDLPFTHSVSSDGGFSSETRGVLHQGLSTGPTTFHNIIDYVTIASTGDALDFGDTTTVKLHCAGLSSPTRGVWAGGYTPNTTNVMDYVTIASTGNANDFGELTATTFRLGGCSSAIRGLFFGGGGAPSITNTISYITIATTGNIQDFGDLVQQQEFTTGTSSSTRGVKVGGSDSSPGPYSPVGTIEYFEIATTGNAQSFGDLFVARARGGTFSNGHGGLG